ncbi:cysteine desulfurase family protein [Scatolibacter rhodanostii]|uniref:cysteine desulfurase family protein n=1 Tax=Scatolibacter rhodanostii TaxID=2014781 RepID=UPI000C07EC50|nr:cysteine desulfurase family protein [Scatolibacter rhodanostii]
MEHYLDNSATTKVLESSAQKALFLMTEEYGNPSSLHTRGFRAKCELDNARETIAKSLGADAGEIYFTSGGTESNNLAIFGAVQAQKRRGNRIVTTKIEHPSVLEPMKELEKQGFEVIYLKLKPDGTISTEELQQAIDGNTILVSMMLVNNETGSVQPVKAAADIIRRKKLTALLHTDAVQAYLKMPISVTRLGVDLLSLSGHKIHAPKGVGALYVAKKARILPTHFGGGQEKKIRSGTESLPLIGALAEAVQQGEDIQKNLAWVAELNAALRKNLSAIPEIQIHSAETALPYILNFSAGRIRSETMLHFLSAEDIYVSSGSACGKGKPSHVLAALGLDKQEVDSSIRVSFSRFNTKEDVEVLTAALKEGIHTLHHA